MGEKIEGNFEKSMEIEFEIQIHSWGKKIFAVKPQRVGDIKWCVCEFVGVNVQTCKGERSCSRIWIFLRVWFIGFVKEEEEEK